MSGLPSLSRGTPPGIRAKLEPVVRSTSTLGLAFVLAACAAARTEAPPPAPTPVAASPSRVERPRLWAEPLSRLGLPNLHRVSPVYYRSAQPTREGMQEAVKLGVRTVVNLRAVTSDRALLEDLPLRYEHISVKAWHAEDEDAVRFLRIVSDPAYQPVLVHCQHGADRTGMMTALYRIAIQGWSKQDAIAEMTQGGFGYHAIWGNLVGYVRQADVPRLLAEADVQPQGR